jgi:hypothetical protein
VSRSQATIALTALVVVFALGLIDYLNPPYVDFIPEPISRLVSTILIGVTIGLILAAFRNGNDSGASQTADDERVARRTHRYDSEADSQSGFDEGDDGL